MRIDATIWDRLVAAAVAARDHAYAPYSGFSVGAALYTAGGRIAAGCNVENVSFPCGQCAEASAVGALISAVGSTAIRAVVVAAGPARFVWPCGQCRQILAEFGDGDTAVMAVAGDRRSEPLALAALLPHAFDTLD